MFSYLYIFGKRTTFPLSWSCQGVLIISLPALDLVTIFKFFELSTFSLDTICRRLGFFLVIILSITIDKYSSESSLMSHIL
jgi:hypothetical protein